VKATTTRRIAARVLTRRRRRPRCWLDSSPFTEDYNKDQPYYTDALIEAVKSISEFDASVTKATEIRQQQHAEFVPLTINIAIVTELLKLAVDKVTEMRSSTQRIVRMSRVQIAVCVGSNRAPLHEAPLIDKVAHVPVVKRRLVAQQVPTSQEVQFVDRIADVPVVLR